MSRTATLLLAAAVVVVVWPLAVPATYDTHDGHYALYNAAQFDAALRDGQVPVRWLPDLFGGRGLPHFVFYHPLFFYLVSAVHLLGLGFVPATRIVVALSVAGAAASMFAFLRERVAFGAAIAGAAAWVAAPMLGVEVHVKGDPPAVLAWAIVPLVLLGAGRAAEGKARGVLLLALASAALVLAHGVTAMLFAPFACLWALACRTPGWIPRVLAGGTLGAALSCWQWLPALVERKFVHIDSPLGILFFDFREHFVAVWQWLSPLWGYHGSFAGTNDDMSFQTGPVQAAAIVAATVFWRRLPAGPLRRLAGWGLATAGVSLLMTLEISRPIWEAIGPLRYAQFPWRFLAPAAAGAAALVALAVERAPRGAVVAASCAAPAAITLLCAVFTGNVWYFAIAGAYAAGAAVVALAFRRSASLAATAMLAVAAVPWTAVPLHHRFHGEPAIVPLTEADLAPERVRLGIRRTTARDDYLPRTVTTIPPRDPSQEYLPPGDATPPPFWETLSGDARVVDLDRRSAEWTFRLEGKGLVALELHDFPGWTARCDGKVVAHRDDDRGRIVLDPETCGGEVRARYERTPDRRLALWISLGGAIGCGLVALRKR